jgi:hypothetical protein
MDMISIFNKPAKAVQTFLVSGILIITLFTAQQALAETAKVSVQEAEKQLKPHIQLIRQRLQEMNNKYDAAHAKPALKSAFQEKRLFLVLDHADSWGGGVQSLWMDSEKFYKDHLTALEQSLDIIKQTGYAKPSDLEYLNNGMNNWKTQETVLDKQFDEAFNSMVISGIDYEKILKFRKEMNDISAEYFKRNAYEWSDWYESSKPKREQQETLYNEASKRDSALWDQAVKPIYDIRDQKVFEAINMRKKAYLLYALEFKKTPAQEARITQLQKDIKAKEEAINPITKQYEAAKKTYLQTQETLAKLDKDKGFAQLAVRVNGMEMDKLLKTEKWQPAKEQCIGLSDCRGP